MLFTAKSAFSIFMVLVALVSLLRVIQNAVTADDNITTAIMMIFFMFGVFGNLKFDL